MNEQEIIFKAKGHIRMGEFARARGLLEAVPKNPVAIDLLRRIDEQEARKKARRIQKQGQGGGLPRTVSASARKVQNIPRVQGVEQAQDPLIVQNIVQKTGYSIPRPALLIILGSMGLWGVAITIMAMSSGRVNNLAFVVLGLLAFYGITFAVYYLVWRFYWWAIAIGWMLSACLLITALLLGLQMPDLARLLPR